MKASSCFDLARNTKSRSNRRLCWILRDITLAVWWGDITDGRKEAMRLVTQSNLAALPFVEQNV